MKWQCAVEFKLEDMWIGVFWKHSEDCLPTGAPEFRLPIFDRTDIWICLVPCLPLHIAIWRKQKQ